MSNGGYCEYSANALVLSYESLDTETLDQTFQTGSFVPMGLCIRFFVVVCLLLAVMTTPNTSAIHLSQFDECVCCIGILDLDTHRVICQIAVN